MHAIKVSTPAVVISLFLVAIEVLVVVVLTASNATVGIQGQESIQNSIGNLITKLVCEDDINF